MNRGGSVGRGRGGSGGRGRGRGRAAAVLPPSKEERKANRKAERMQKKHKGHEPVASGRPDDDQLHERQPPKMRHGIRVEDDEDIDDDIAFTEEDEALYGAFFTQRELDKEKRKQAREDEEILEGDDDDVDDDDDDVSDDGLEAGADEEDEMVDLSDLLDTEEERAAKKAAKLAAKESGSGRRSKKKIEETLQEATPSAGLDQLMAAAREHLPSEAQDRMEKMTESAMFPMAADKHIDESEERQFTRTQVARDMKKWNHLVRQMRTADHVQFPLRSANDTPAIQTGASLTAPVDPRTDLEKRIAAALEDAGLAFTGPTGDEDEDDDDGGKWEGPRPDIVFKNPGEQDDDEAAHEGSMVTAGYLSKLKAVMSYNVEKRKRTNKIRSKSYHKMMRKEKEKVKERELKELHEKDPAAAAEKRKQLMDKLRAAERATLKHKNTSKWVKHVKRVAMWDKDARDALNEEQRIHQQLTAKMNESALEDAAGRSSGDDSDTEHSRKKKKVSAPTTTDSLLSSLPKGTPFDKAREELAGMTFMKRAMEKRELAAIEGLAEAGADGLGVAAGATLRKKFNAVETPGQVNLPAADLDDDVSGGRRAKKAKKAANKPAAEAAVVKPPPTSTTNADLIRSAFADDDVLAELQKEKDDAVGKDAAPVDANQALPGWDEWGGQSKVLNRRQAARHARLELARKMEMDELRKKRRDAGLEHVVINENADTQPAPFVLTKVPFPYTSAEQYDRAMRMPLGKEWNTSLAMDQLTRPTVSRRTGAIIDPLDDAIKQKQKPVSKLRKDTDNNKKKSKATKRDRQ
eukprot:PhM_4_TR9056/c0_g1_i1/m.60014/K14567/UTP14; U3 small nucleolar RNA-associated protein 14